MLLRIAEIVFFLVYGINTFYPIPSAAIILGVAAIIIGIALIIG